MTKNKDATETFPCSYCGFDMEVPKDFIPDDAGQIVEEKYDPETGAYLVIVKQPLLQCRNCRVDTMMGRKTIKPKGKARPKKDIIKPAKSEQKESKPSEKPDPDDARE